MELAELLGYVGVFFGGGLGGAWIQHRWQVKAAKEAAQWPRDVERIDKLRELCRSIYARHLAVTKSPTSAGLERALDRLYSQDGTRQAGEVEYEGDCWVFELDDDLLRRAWYEFKHRSAMFIAKYQLAENDEERRHAAVEYDLSYEGVMRRLRELERGS